MCLKNVLNQLGSHLFYGNKENNRQKVMLYRKELLNLHSIL